MNINLHNKVEISSGNKKVVFYNNMLKSVKEKLSSLDSYFDYFALGTGKNEIVFDNYKLGNYIKTINLETEAIQSNIEKGDLFVKKYAIINDPTLDGVKFTEAGICDTIDNNPTVYNYFSLTCPEYPDGIFKEAGKELAITITIYLTIEDLSKEYFTLGENKFIEFLLGQGMKNKEFYACRGKNLSQNKFIYREKFDSTEKSICKLSFSKNTDNLQLNFTADLGIGETNEIVFFLDDSPIARINTREFHKTQTTTKQITSQKYGITDLGENIKSVSKLTNASTNEIETEAKFTKYATGFGDKISLPFSGLFDNQTPRFLSKDANKIFFVSDDKVFGYENINYSIVEIKIDSGSIKNISKVIAFGSLIFIVSKSAPYISAFIKDGLKYVPCFFDFSLDESTEVLNDIFDIDITIGRNNIVMFGIIKNETKNALVLYFSLDEANKKLTLINKLSSNREYLYVLAMYRNTYSDSVITFLKINPEDSLQTRMIYYFPDQTVDDMYSTVCWQITQNMKEIYIKSRAIVVERAESPSLWIYFYPEWLRYTLSNDTNEENDYVSTNLLYLIQKFSKNSYKIYSLVGYKTLREFDEGFPKNLDMNKFVDFEFLNDTLLIFTSDQKEPIIAYNFYENKSLLENVKNSESEYIIEEETYVPLGKENEGVTATFAVKIYI